MVPMVPVVPHLKKGGVTFFLNFFFTGVNWFKVFVTIENLQHRITKATERSETHHFEKLVFLILLKNVDSLNRIS